MMLDKNVLNQLFTGTEKWHRYSPLFPKVLLTDGALYLAQEGGAFWLMDLIASSQINKQVKKEPFQVWRLMVHKDNSATITGEDGNGNVIYTQYIEKTDFPLDSIDIWAGQEEEHLIILLPSEY